ncbi:MAG: SDR family oxidoreductase [Pseudomonadales bacterium]
MILITGANGHIGRRLISALLPSARVRALVRSERAAASLADTGAEVRIVDYLDTRAMTASAQGCSHAVHLVGVIKESSTTTFEAAHEATTRVLAAAAADASLRRIVYLSILGAHVGSGNACLASKARAEHLLAEGAVPSLVIRVPMVLGEGDHASRALFHRARRRVDFQFRAGSFEQPIYAGDVVAALRSSIGDGDDLPAAMALDLAGPESLTRAELTRRAARTMDVRGPVTISLPVSVGMFVAALLERLSDDPPLSRAMLGVLDHDDHIDPSPALSALSLSLTPLDQALHRCLVENPPI